MIIHGSYGHPFENWIPWLHTHLSERGNKCMVPSFPTPDGQTFSSWERLLNFYANEGILDKSTTIITHSVSCVFVVKFCVKNNFEINRFISIAGFNNINFDYDPSLKNLCDSFYDSPEFLSKFKGLCPKRISFYSNNDPYVSLEKGAEFADAISAFPVLIPNAGHFNCPPNKYEFKELLDYLK